MRYLARLVVFVVVVGACACATPGALSVRVASSAEIDARAYWLSVRPNSSVPHYAIRAVAYFADGDQGNNGSTNIYVTVVDENGAPISGVRVWQCWPDDCAAGIAQAGAVNFYMSGDSSFAPDRGEAGPYWVRMDEPSEWLLGLGLPLKRHVQYYVTIVRVTASTPTPTPTATATSSATPTVAVTVTPTPTRPPGDGMSPADLARWLRRWADELEGK
jgi:hypothetical protein